MSQPANLNGGGVPGEMASDDGESMSSQGSSYMGGGGGGDAVRSSARKRKDVNYKERKSHKPRTLAVDSLYNQMSQVTSSVTLTEEPSTSKSILSQGPLSAKKSGRHSVNFETDSSMYINSSTDEFLNQSASCNVDLEINSKFYTFDITRQAYQVIFDKSEKYEPERVEICPNDEIILLSSNNIKGSRFTFFDSQTLEVKETSEFPFVVLDFCVGKNSMFFTNGKQLYAWKLDNRELGYDTLDLPDIEESIASLSAANETVGMVFSKTYTYFDSILVYKVVDNRKSQALDAIKQHNSELDCKIDPFSFTMLENSEDRFVAMKQVKRQVTLYKIYSKKVLVELMKFCMSLPGVESMRLTQGPATNSLLATVHTSRRGSSLVFLDWSKKTAVTLLTNDQSEMCRAGHVNNPIGCCFSQSKLAMIHHENFKDRQRLSLFDLKVKQMPSKKSNVYFLIVLAILMCIVAVIIAYIYGNIDIPKFSDWLK